MSYEKNLIDILKALNYLKNKDIELTIVGDGEEKYNLIKYVQRNGLSKNVICRSKKNPQNFLSKSNLYINSSFFEGFQTQLLKH